MTHMEIYQDGMRCHRDLAKVTAELAQELAAHVDTTRSLLNSVEATVGYQRERNAALATLARVEALAAQWGQVGDHFASLNTIVADLRIALAEPTP